MVEREQDIENAAPLQSESNEKGGRRRESARARERERGRERWVQKGRGEIGKTLARGFCPSFPLYLALREALSASGEREVSRKHDEERTWRWSGRGRRASFEEGMRDRERGGERQVIDEQRREETTSSDHNRPQRRRESPLLPLPLCFPPPSFDTPCSLPSPPAPFPQAERARRSLSATSLQKQQPGRLLHTETRGGTVPTSEGISAAPRSLARLDETGGAEVVRHSRGARSPRGPSRCRQLKLDKWA
jgi:hypothetical protein